MKKILLCRNALLMKNNNNKDKDTTLLSNYTVTW